MASRNICARRAKAASNACASTGLNFSSFIALIRKFPRTTSSARCSFCNRKGKINHIGLSEVSVKEIEHARSIVPIVSVQNRYSVVDRAAEDVVDYCDRAQIGFIPWFPLASGDVSKSGSSLEDAAAKLKITPSQLALAWLLHRSPVMLPIPGTSRVEHLEENVAAAAVKVDDATLKGLRN